MQKKSSRKIELLSADKSKSNTTPSKTSIQSNSPFSKKLDFNDKSKLTPQTSKRQEQPMRNYNGIKSEEKAIEIDSDGYEDDFGNEGTSSQDMDDVLERMMTKGMDNKGKNLNADLEEINIRKPPMEDLTPEELEYLRGFQKVFVEDLGRELLMDPNGNLYDEDGQLIGQADSDEFDDQNDDKYFEEPESVNNRLTNKKLPPLSHPGMGKQAYKH